MSNNLDEIRKRLQNSTQNSTSNYSSDAFYAFWDTPFDSTVSIRFLPDGDGDNVFFWRERQIIRIPFKNVEGHDDLENVIVEVPCVRMYGKNESCPILSETKSWWKTEKEDLARLYWPKKTYLYQGFVRNSPIKEETTPENPIRRFIINKTIHKLIESALLDPEMENTPVDYDCGIDFNIKKTKNGEWAEYGTSSFARKETSLTLEEREAIEKHGLFDLSSFLPKKPDETELGIIYDMFVESLSDNSTYRLEWANAYKPKNTDLNLSNTNSGSSTSSNTTTVSTNNSQTSSVSAKQEKTSETQSETASGSSNSDAILAQLRNRINNNNN